MAHFIGNHTLTHERLVDLSPETLEREIGDSARPACIMDEEACRMRCMDVRLGCDRRQWLAERSSVTIAFVFHRAPA